MEGNQSRRIDFVDLTKGVCIVLVVMAHVGGAFEQLDTNSMLSCFRMPLYFFISGVFFKSYEGLFGFILRKINKLIIPFLFFYLSAFLMKYIVWKIAPGVFQLPVSWNELLVVFHGHDLIKFNPPIWFLLALQHPVLSNSLSARKASACHVRCDNPDWLRRILSRKITDRVTPVYRCFHDCPPLLCGRFLDPTV